MTDAERTVWVMKPNGSVPNVYHTETDCQHVDSEEANDRTLGSLPWDIPKCRFCAGEVEVSNGDRSHIESLKDEAARLESGGSV
jgi:hypothetical protein